MISKQPDWRLLNTPAAAGAWNMAVDEALLESAGAGLSPPVLRLYAWEPACLSLGYGQRAREAAHPTLKSMGWDLVRRPTGGRAILHIDELTYSVIAPKDHPVVAGDILESYERISRALLTGLELLAVPAVREAAYDLPAGSDPKGPVCFEVPANWEITVDGKKLVGSAQVRRKNGVLQHGTIPLRGDLARITKALAFHSTAERNNAARRLLGRATTVEKALGRLVSWEEAAAAMRAGFEAGLGVKFFEDTLTESEAGRAGELVDEKYGNDGWNLRR